LRHDDTLRGELLFDTDGAGLRANANRTGLVESDEGVLGRIAYGHGLGLD
jgi:hypothetical protein